MVGRRRMSPWWAVGMSALMALSLAAVTGGAAAAQDASAAPAASAAATECAPVEPTGPLPDLTAQLGHKPKVGLVMKSLANEFFQQMDKGAKDYAATKADIFDFQTVGMKDERDFAAQLQAVENYITQKFDVIVIAPADSKAMVEPIARALEAGIKVINIDVALDQQAMADAGIDLAFFGPDNRAGAKLAGDALGQKLGEGGKVVILEGNPEADNAVQRKTGFDDSVAEYKLDLLESTTAHWETAEAEEITSNFLTKYPDLQGIMAANDSMALGAIAALDAAGKTGQVQVVGFDNIPGVRQYIKDGVMLATVEQYGADMAKFGIDFGLRELAGESFCGWVQTPVSLVTAENVVVE
jgi:ribose transport system substrate-binding protein